MKETITPYEAMNLALEKAGSQAELARIAGVSPTAVWKWVDSAKRVSPQAVLKIEKATGVSRYDLRPDYYPRETLIDGRVGTRFAGVDQSSMQASAL